MAADPEPAVAASLQRLLSRQKQKFPFVLIEDQQTRKFVQFAMDKNGLFIDLPTVALTAPERTRAIALFRERHREPGTIAAPQENGPTQSLETFQALFGRDSQAAAHFAMRVFSEVYRLPSDAKLHVVESNQENL